MLRHTRLGKRALTAAQVAREAGLTPQYVRRLEADAIPLMPEAGELLLGILADSPRDVAIMVMTAAILRGATADARLLAQ